MPSHHQPSGLLPIRHHERERHIMTTFRAALVTSRGAELAMVDRTLADPGPGPVRVAVEACGICHSDSLFVDDQWPGLQFPVTPGHEIAGRIDALLRGRHGYRRDLSRWIRRLRGGACERAGPHSRRIVGG